MKELGTETCKLLGGEPSIYPHIQQVLSQLKSARIRSVMISNGLVYSDKKTMEQHFTTGLDSLIISLKAGTPQSYKKLTRVDALNKVLQAMKNLTEFTGGVTITLTTDIVEEILPAISLIADTGIRFVNLHLCSPMLVSGVPENHSMILPDKAAIAIVKAVETLEKVGLSYNIQVSIPFCLFEPEFIYWLMQKNCITSGCIVTKKSGIIFGTKGEAGFCNHLMDYPFGKLAENFSTGDELESLYGNQSSFFEITNRAPTEKCLDCPMNLFCCGGCPLQWTQFDPNTYISGGKKFADWDTKLKTIVTNSNFYQQ